MLWRRNLTKNIENTLEAGVYAEAVMGSLRQIAFSKSREKNKVLNIDAIHAVVGEIVLELEHLLTVLLSDWLPDGTVAVPVTHGRNLVVKFHARCIV